MNYLVLCLCYLAGVFVPIALAWLIFIYPFTEISLKKPLILFGAGALSGFVFLFVVLYLFTVAWPRD